jgi:ABC-type glycerol-3-phosphate transport system substrate-binding protein
MMIDGEWAIGELAGVDTIDWAVAPLPPLNQGTNNQPAASLVLARYWAVGRSTSGNRALAMAALLEYLSDPDRQLAWTEQFGLLPTRRQALDEPLIAGHPALGISAAQMQAGQSVPLGVNTNAILNAMREPLRGALEGDLTVTEAAEMMQQNVE